MKNDSFRGMLIFNRCQPFEKNSDGYQKTQKILPKVDWIWKRFFLKYNKLQVLFLTRSSISSRYNLQP